MTAIRLFEYRKVSAMPEVLDSGVLYHAPAYGVASHLCACGCKYEAVTRLASDRWSLSFGDRGPSLWPSIGNGSFPCRSHYFILNGAVRWAGKYTDEMIAMARAQDNPRAHTRRRSGWAWLRNLFSWITGNKE